jgi:ABC-type multidrug transport system fused ATPase/permease subunit
MDSSLIHHPRYTASDAASGKERKAEMTDSKPPEQRDTKRVILIGAVGLALYLLLGIVLWLLLNSYVDPTAIKDPSTEATAKKDVIQALGFIMAGVAGAVGIFFTWRGQRLAREAQEDNQSNTLVQLENAREQLRLTQQSQEQNQQSTQAQLENAQEELRLTRQGQMTERFTQAIEQLGSDKLEIKLGGIYSLERTAQEEQNYHWPVMEVLTSYVRQHAPLTPDEEPNEKPDEKNGSRTRHPSNFDRHRTALRTSQECGVRAYRSEQYRPPRS